MYLNNTPLLLNNKEDFMNIKHKVVLVLNLLRIGTITLDHPPKTGELVTFNQRNYMIMGCTLWSSNSKRAFYWAYVFEKEKT